MVRDVKLFLTIIVAFRDKLPNDFLLERKKKSGYQLYIVVIYIILMYFCLAHEIELL